MGQFGSFAVFQRVTADALNLTIPYTIVKAASQTVASSTTLTNDNELILPVAANAQYFAEFFINYSGLVVTTGTTWAGFKTGWSVPAGATGLKAVHGEGDAAANFSTTDNAANNVTSRWGVHGYTTAINYGHRNIVGNQAQAYETSVITIAATAGSIVLQWAQTTSNATGTVVGAGSFARLTQLA